MEYKPTLSSAIEFSKADKLEKWIHLFLCGEGNNKAFSDGLKLEPRRFYSPKMIELDKLERCCGPEKNMKFQIPKKNFIKRINDIISAYNKGDWDMPPLIVYRKEKVYEINDGNHRYEALKKVGINKYWVIMWETVI